MINVDKTKDEPLYQQIYESVRQTIVSGGFKAGESLPSIRSLMNDLDVSRNTVSNAYCQLCAEGYVTSRQGCGYIVSDISADTLPNIALTCDTARDRHTPIVVEPQERSYKFDFYYGNLLKGSFPSEDWRRLTTDVLYSMDLKGMTSYNRKRGEIGLRNEIARYLRRSRGVQCEPEQIVLTSGTQQSIEHILSLFDPEKHAFGMENPGYDGSRIVVEDAGFSIVPLRTDAGAEAFLDDVRESDAKLIYTTPSHQMPTGGLMEIGTRMELLHLAAEKNMYILEDDYDSEFRFNARPIPSLQSIDSWERVIYLGTFSKILSPALRLSYVVLPPKLLNAYNLRFKKYYSTIPWLQQEVLRRFMENNLWDKHVRRVVRDVRMRHSCLMECIESEFGKTVQMIGGTAGLHLLLKVSNGMCQEELIEAAAAHDVKVCSTRHYWINPSDSPDDTVLLGYSSASIPEIESGISELKRAWF